MKKDNRWLIAGGMGAIAVGLVGTMFFVTADFGKEPLAKTAEPVEVASQPNEKKEDSPKEKTTEVEYVMTPYTSLITPVGYGTDEFPEEQSATFKEELLKLAEGGEVEALLSEMERKLERYRFSEGTNLEIAGLYYDAAFTNGLVGKTEKEMRQELPDVYKTPEMLALMPLYLPELARRDMIHDNLSLTPLTEGPWKINDTRIIDNREDAMNDEAYAENGVAISMFNVIEGLHQIRVVEMIRVEEPDVLIRAYIAELANGQLQLYGYYIPDGTTHYYQNIEFFKKLDEEYLIPNEAYQQEQMQAELDNGNIPDAALDEFLNPTK